jgi:hypothetical protein
MPKKGLNGAKQYYKLLMHIPAIDRVIFCWLKNDLSGARNSLFLLVQLFAQKLRPEPNCTIHKRFWNIHRACQHSYPQVWWTT